MPSYDYRCTACDKTTTVIKSMSKADRPERCACDKGALMERILAPPMVKVSGGTPKFHRRSGS